MVSVHFWAMPSWSHPCLCVSILFYHPREYHLWSCQWSIQFGCSYPIGGMSFLTLELEKVLFHLEHQIVLDQEDGVLKRNTTESWSTTRFYKVLCHPLMEGKVAWEIEKSSSFRLSRYPSSYTVNASFTVSCAPSFINLGMRILLRRRTVTPYVRTSLIIFIKALIKNQIPWLI
jgi:hypothetical protein